LARHPAAGQHGRLTGFSFAGIAPDGMYEYRFKVVQSGTYWYHSHSGFQEQLGVYGALIIDPKEPEPFSYDRDYVVFLSDWTDESPARVLAKLKKRSDYYNRGRRTLAISSMTSPTTAGVTPSASAGPGRR